VDGPALAPRGLSFKADTCVPKNKNAEAVMVGYLTLQKKTAEIAIIVTNAMSP
jgi:hypothetical protein